MTTSAKKSPPSLMLLDSASMYFRAFFGVPEITADDGTPVNAVRGFMDFISRLVGQYDPDQLVCCWDNDWRPAWRVELLPTYKTHRVVAERATGPDIEEVPDPLEVQVPIILEVLDAFGITVRGADGYEADDVIGTLATGAAGPVDVVTGDRDLFQVVDDEAGVRVLYIARGVGNHERVDNAWMRAKYGVDAAQYADFATLRGDASDGLPGVAGHRREDRRHPAQPVRRHGRDHRGRRGPRLRPRPGSARQDQGRRGLPLGRAQVVAVARDLDLDRTGLDRPVTPRDPDAVTDSRERYNLESPAARLVEALIR